MLYPAAPTALKFGIQTKLRSALGLLETNDAMSLPSKDIHDMLNSQYHSSCGPPAS